MIDHITIRVSDLEKSKNFYEKVLHILGMSIVLGSAEEGYYGFGIGDEPYFEISQADAENPAHKRVHVAFKAQDKNSIDNFYNKAIELGASDNGAPGPRPDYTPTYYAAFIRDYDDNNIEVCTY